MNAVKYTSKGNFVVNHVAGEIIVVPVTDSVAALDSLLVINEVGEFIIKGVQDGLTNDAIVERMADEFDLPSKEQALTDLNEFAQLLVKHGFFETA